MPFDAERYKDVPFVEDGQDPPGSFQNRSWIGKHRWLTRHGKAVVEWSLGNPRRAFDVKFADARIDVDNIGIWRRPHVGDCDWVYGTVEIAATDVLFKDSLEQPAAYELPAQSEMPSLEYDLAHDSSIRQALKKKPFAEMLFTALAGQDFVRLDSGREWHFTERKAAHFVAHLRGRGEYYLDYYPHALSRPPQAQARVRRWLDERLNSVITGETSWAGPPIEGFVEILGRFRKTRSIEVDEGHPLFRFLQQEKTDWDRTLEDEKRDRALPHLRRLGWRPKSEAEYEREFVRDRRARLDRRVALLVQIRHFETLEPRPRPGWAQKITLRRTFSADVRGLENLSSDDTEAASAELVSRLFRLAKTGRVSETEFRMMEDTLFE